MPPAKSSDVKAVRFADLYKTSSFSPLAAGTPTVELRTLSNSSEEDEHQKDPAAPPQKASTAEPSGDGPLEPGEQASAVHPATDGLAAAEPVLEAAPEAPPPEEKPPAPGPDLVQPEASEPSQLPGTEAPEEEAAAAVPAAEGSVPEPPAALASAPEGPPPPPVAPSEEPSPPPEQPPPAPKGATSAAAAKARPSALFNFSALSLATGSEVAEGLMAEAAQPIMSTGEAANHLSQLGVKQPKLQGFNALPDGGVVLAVPKPGVALHRVTSQCARTLRAPQLEQALQDLRRRIDALTKGADADTLDGLHRALERLPSEVKGCAPGLQEASAGVLSALSSWKAARSTHLAAHRVLQKAQQALQKSSEQLERAKQDLQASAKDAETVEQQALQQLRRHWGGLRNTVSRALLVTQQMR
jgi:hypothetical protein